ncbi:hypothetical protein ACJX0J_029423, partial [Zea mays]
SKHSNIAQYYALNQLHHITVHPILEQNPYSTQFRAQTKYIVYSKKKKRQNSDVATMRRGYREGTKVQTLWVPIRL